MFKRDFHAKLKTKGSNNLRYDNIKSNDLRETVAQKIGATHISHCRSCQHEIVIYEIT